MSEHAALTLAAGQYHQYLRAPESSLSRVDPGGSLERTRPMTLGSASHLALTLDQELGSGMRLGIEGYFKSFHDLPGAQESDGNASGVDLWVRRNDGPWNGWLGYSLAWVWSATDEMNRTRFAGRQLLSAGISGPVGQLGSVQFGLVYGAGLPYSSIQLSGGENDQLAFADVSTTVGDLSGAADVAPLLPEPNHPYLRIDLGVSRDWTGHLLGAPLSLSPYFRLLNSLGQRDALFYRYRPDTDPAPQPLLFIPVVPVAGVEVKF
jgi:hypothetical protein